MENEFDFDQQFARAVKRQSAHLPKRGQPNDKPEDDATPPPGFVKARFPFLQKEFIPRGWKKVGDTYVSDEE